MSRIVASGDEKDAIRAIAECGGVPAAVSMEMAWKHDPARWIECEWGRCGHTANGERLFAIWDQDLKQLVSILDADDPDPTRLYEDCLQESEILPA